MKELLTSWRFRRVPSDEEYEEVTVPHTWYQEGNGYKGAAEYVTSFRTEELTGKAVIIRFLAADRYAKVYINGSFAGEHKGGYSAFAFNVTCFCREHYDNTVTILLDNRSQDEISPLAGDFTVFGGLYRNVELFITDSVTFDRTYFGTEGILITPQLKEGKGILSIENHLLGEITDETELEYRVIDPEGREAVVRRTGFTEYLRLTLDNPVPWEGRLRPALYKVEVSILKGGRKLEAIELETGFRSIKADSRHGFTLNGKQIRLNGVARHQDAAEVFNTASLKEYLEDMAFIEEIGANAIRLSHYQHAQEFYTLCDRRGFIVWAEIPMLRLIEAEACLENAELQLKELILQNLHHVSICFWGIQNEIAIFGEDEGMYEKMRRLENTVKQLDSTRLSGSANLYCVRNDSPLNRITDVVGYNIYFGWYYGEMPDNRTFVESFNRDNPDVPLLITEYGVDANPQYHSESPKVKDYSEEFQALYHETVYPIFQSQKYLMGSFVWNMFDFSSDIRDEGGTKYRNAKGLVSYDRKIRKDAFYYYKAQWTDTPFVHIAGKRFLNRTAERISIRVYSNQKEVILETANETFQQTSDNGVFIFKDIPLSMGVNHFTARSGAEEDTAAFNRQCEADSSYIFIDTTPGIKVKNWFTDQVEEERLFPAGKFSIRDNISLIKADSRAFSVIEEYLPSLAAELKDRGGTMPLEKILAYKKNEITDSQCRTLNCRLTKISK